MKSIFELANHCISVLFTKHSRKTEKEIFIVLQNENPLPIYQNLITVERNQEFLNTPPRIANTELENNGNNAHDLEKTTTAKAKATSTKSKATPAKKAPAKRATTTKSTPAKSAKASTPKNKTVIKVINRR